MALQSLPPELAPERAREAIWTFPSILGSAFLVAWGAEAAQFLVSQGLALALLAWLQTLPEFAVEAVIAWNRDVPLMTANFTGSLRLLTGLAWPMIFLVTWVTGRRRGRRAIRIHLEPEHSIEVLGLVPPLLYFWVIYFKGTLALYDSAVLLVIYAGYLWTLGRLPPREMEEVSDLPRVSRWVLARGALGRWAGTLALFLVGGAILYMVAHRFLESMLGLAMVLGVSQFVFVQWVSPFLSEFPEKVSAFLWARQADKAPMALVNMISSNINQWTVLVAMIPIVYCLSLGRPEEIRFDGHQRAEILLTMAQAYVGFALLANLEFTAFEAAGLFLLWVVQFFVPGWREEVTVAYWLWFAVECLRALGGGRRLDAFRYFVPLVSRALHPSEALATARRPGDRD
jgi:cation:H+ antiporter